MYLFTARGQASHPIKHKLSLFCFVLFWGRGEKKHPAVPKACLLLGLHFRDDSWQSWCTLYKARPFPLSTISLVSPPNFWIQKFQRQSIADRASSFVLNWPGFNHQYCICPLQFTPCLQPCQEWPLSTETRVSPARWPQDRWTMRTLVVMLKCYMSKIQLSVTLQIIVFKKSFKNDN